MEYRKKYLQEEVPKLLALLRPDHKRAFGVMSPQHMIEHLIMVTKTSLKDYGPAPEQLSEGQESFMRFVKKGAYLLHRPGSSSKDNLQHLRMPSLEAAVDEIPKALDRLYQNKKDQVFFNPMMGLLSFEEMELFHYMHYKYHLQHQFGLGLYPVK